MKQDKNLASRPPEGLHANYFRVGCNTYEFVLDFGQLDPETSKAVFHSRIIAVPHNAKTLLETLEAAVRRYVRDFGPIDDLSSQPIRAFHSNEED